MAKILALAIHYIFKKKAYCDYNLIAWYIVLWNPKIIVNWEEGIHALWCVVYEDVMMIK